MSTFATNQVEINLRLFGNKITIMNKVPLPKKTLFLTFALRHPHFAAVSGKKKKP
jgi:hypothetical protein